MSTQFMWLQIPKRNYITVAGIRQNLIWIKNHGQPYLLPNQARNQTQS